MGAVGAHFFCAGTGRSALPQLGHENDRASPQCSWQKWAVSFAICPFEGVKVLGPNFALIKLTGPQAA
jgi:hypothetical protein